MDKLHALLVGAAASVLTGLLSWVGHVDLGALTKDPILLGLLGVAVAAASKGLGSLLNKIGLPK